MAVTRAEKATEITTLEGVFQRSGAAILIDYRGINVPQVTELRAELRKARAGYRVVKNTLARRALEGTGFEALGVHFNGTTAVAYTEDDPVALARTLTAFVKNAPMLQIKAAVVQGRAIAVAEVAELANLPGRPELYARLLFLLQAPMASLLRVLTAPPRNLLSVLVQAEEKRSARS